MNKIYIKLLFLISILLISSCSYEPIFSKKNYNIKLEEISFSGEREINRIIKNQLSLIKSSEYDNSKVYSMNIYSEVNKTIISKDSKGDPEKFEFVIEVMYEVIQDSRVILERELEKKYIYNNDSDKFKLKQSEKIILENLTKNMCNIIISSIINIDDN